MISLSKESEWVIWKFSEKMRYEIGATSNKPVFEIVIPRWAVRSGQSLNQGGNVLSLSVCQFRPPSWAVRPRRRVDTRHCCSQNSVPSPGESRPGPALQATPPRICWGHQRSRTSVDYCFELLSAKLILRLVCKVSVTSSLSCWSARRPPRRRGTRWDCQWEAGGVRGVRDVDCDDCGGDVCGPVAGRLGQPLRLSCVTATSPGL